MKAKRRSNATRPQQRDPNDKRRQPLPKSRPMSPAEMVDFEERVVQKNRPEPLPPKRLIPS